MCYMLKPLKLSSALMYYNIIEVMLQGEGQYGIFTVERYWCEDSENYRLTNRSGVANIPWILVNTLLGNTQ